ncbi:MFS transporter [Alphaproteobacteria bacterium]|nr:MFS transporter [Alphaproteobacteria bacterium]
MRGAGFSEGAKSSQEKDHKKRFSQDQALPRMVWIIGIVMFCANMASVIVYSFGGVYLKEVMGVKTFYVGVIEGVAECTSNLMKLLAGVLSDIFQRRKILMVFGYGIVVCARYILALFSMYCGPVIFARVAERIGNGMQAAPRSALVGDISPPKRIGASYGLKRSLATLGSFSGAVVALFIMSKTQNNYKILFKFTTLPITFGFIFLIFKVKDPLQMRQSAVLAGVPSYAPKYRPTFHSQNFKLLGSTFWKLMSVNFVFLMARMGETFLMLYGREFHIEPKFLPTIMMVFNLSWAASSYPVGLIADKMNRYWLLCFGMVSLGLADFVFSTAHTLPAFFVGVMLWGIQYGTTQNIFLSLINEVVPEILRGTGLGIYWVISAITVLLCDSTMGRIASNCGDSIRPVFVTSGIVSLFGLASLFVIMGYKIRPREQ